MKNLQTDRQTDKQTDDGRQAIRKAHLNFQPKHALTEQIDLEWTVLTYSFGLRNFPYLQIFYNAYVMIYSYTRDNYGS